MHEPKRARRRTHMLVSSPSLRSKNPRIRGVATLVLSSSLLLGCGRTGLNTYSRGAADEVGTFSGTSAETDGGEGDDGGGECAAYGDPGVAQDACCVGDTVLSPAGVEGGYCAPSCITTADCPLLPTGSDPGVEALCLIWGSGGEGPEYCAAACKTDQADPCPLGSSCKAIATPGYGICTWP
jgi:hypothetical protein